ncbi:CLIP domain-containing serine protease C9 isoform X1 [Helicoverpa armigera]|uniref:CLIP domain-containing serine protease C9 isoform X1 n=1 Tax=Helicoverpa armigera TaxID=29058 RepID=UPI003083A49A
MIYYLLILSCLCCVCVNSHLDLDEGSECISNVTSKGQNGRCVNIHRCLGYLIDRRQNKQSPICSYQGETPIICCTDCNLVEDMRKMIINEQLGFLYITGKKAEDACTKFKNEVDYDCKHRKGGWWYNQLNRYYRYRSACWNVVLDVFVERPAILGKEAERYQYTHMALLGYGTDMDSALWLCGGSVISERYILTAAHCMSQPSVGPVKYIALGILRRSDPLDMWQRYNVRRVVPHPEYQSPSKYHDIALLETDTEISFNNAVHPACLHTKGEADEVLTFTGWGALGHRQPLADTLQTLNISRFSEEECKQHYPPHRHLLQGYNHTTQMCYGDRVTVADSCEGDSGGPLQSKTLDEHHCVTTVVGVTSAGKQCGITAGSGLYTRVIHYVPWIESVVWP